MERLKQIKEQLISCIQGQMSNIAEADAKELGEVVDMVKDLDEAIYYCTITKAMEEGDKRQHEPRQEMHYYTERHMPDYRNESWGYPGMDSRYDRSAGRMYYDGAGGNQGGSGSTSGNYGNGGTRRYGGEYPMEMRDYREGSSPMRRRMYMETKEMHKGTEAQMKELENYMQELSHDITEMIQDSTPEEKMMLQQKLNSLVQKIK